MEGGHAIDAAGVAWRLGATMLLVVINGFFVAAEFALVKVKRGRIVEMADEGRFTAKVARHILDHLDRYLSSCQLGITLASLVLGALGEPAVGAVITGGLGMLDIGVDPSAGWLRWVSLICAFSVITVLHMTVGEQAPKMWALKNSQPAVLAVSLPLRVFTAVFFPFIAIINGISNAMLRMVGMNPEHGHESVPTRGELRRALELSAQAGHITERGRELAENVLRVMDMKVRHILVPRVNVEVLSAKDTIEEAFALIRKSAHSRYPICEVGLDSVIGIVHTRDVFTRETLPKSHEDLVKLARPPILVPDNWPLGELIAKLQNEGSHVAVVIDEHGTALGLAFLEDALEEIVGPIADEFDEEQSPIKELGPGEFEVKGSMPLPDAIDRFSLPATEAPGNTVGGYVTGLLGRLPQKGDEVEVGEYLVKVTGVARGRAVSRLRFYRVTGDHKPSSKSEEA